jgi:hypothetical protein
VVDFQRQEDLRFLLQAAEGGGLHDALPVEHQRREDGLQRLGMVARQVKTGG